MPRFRCVHCRCETESESLNPACPRCGGAVLMTNEVDSTLERNQFGDLPAGVWRYRSMLPRLQRGEAVTLGEGGTPLLGAERLGEELGLKRLLIKDESRNPTGSFMDRGTTVLVSLARSRGVLTCSCVTIGNLGASLAAYCAKGGLEARIKVPQNVDQGKLYQMLAYGAEIEGASGHPESDAGGALSVTPANPFLLEGEKTTGFELAQELGWTVPDVIVVPVGTGGHLSMIWKSFEEMLRAGLLDASQCRMVGVRLEERPTSTSSRNPAPPSELAESEPFFMEEAERAVDRSGGATLTVSTGETISAMSLLAKAEGVFAEPSSASVVAALAPAVQKGVIDRSERVVCVITGAGLKDTRSILHLARQTRRVGGEVPFAPHSPQMGETKVAILRILKRSPSYGYDLWRTMNTGRRITTASIYQHLSELELFLMVRKKGSVVSGGRERVMYEITHRGNDYLRVADALARPAGK